MKRAYIYPITAYANKTIPNPYLDNFMNCLEKDYQFLNRPNPSSKGIFDIRNYWKEIDAVFLNWVEDLPDKRGGLLQTLFFIFTVYFLKSKKVKIIWTLHNKLSHYKSNYYSKRFLFRFILLKSDFIITHSSEGIRYVQGYKLKNYNKVKFFPHPMEKKFIPFKNNPSNDILIWGSIIPYKGIDQFLEYLFRNSLQDKYRIQIVGKVKPDDYENVILKFCNSNIHLDNRYIPEEDLKSCISDSKVVIFTYAEDSVISSGVLMDTLSFGGNVIAPHVAAFKDAEDAGLIKTFSTYDQLIGLIDKLLNSPRQNNTDVIGRFIEENDWHQFSIKVLNWIN